MSLAALGRAAVALTLVFLFAATLVAQAPADPPPTAQPAAPSAAPAGAESAAANLAKQLSNPVASLISIPMQSNWDFKIGPDEAWKFTLNVQPVVPLTLDKKWNLIVRTILPVAYAQAPVFGGENHFGLGDTVQSFFFSPKEPTSSGWIWGAGPVIYWPTSTSRALGSGDTGAGPTGLILKQEHGWTYGALGNQIWSFASPTGSPDINATFLQPFVSFTTRKLTTWSLNTESTYDWENRQWVVPVNVMVTQLLKLGRAPLQVGLGYRNYVEKPDGAPDWGLRFIVTFLFPK